MATDNLTISSVEYFREFASRLFAAEEECNSPKYSGVYKYKFQTRLAEEFPKVLFLDGEIKVLISEYEEAMFTLNSTQKPLATLIITLFSAAFSNPWGVLGGVFNGSKYAAAREQVFRKTPAFVAVEQIYKHYAVFECKGQPFIAKRCAEVEYYHSLLRSAPSVVTEAGESSGFHSLKQ